MSSVHGPTPSPAPNRRLPLDYDEFIPKTATGVGGSSGGGGVPPDAIRIGGSSGVGGVPPDNVIRIGDNDEPITALETIIKQQTGKELSACGDLQIKGTFLGARTDPQDPSSKTVFTTPYRDPPQNPKEPFCYSFERRWTVTVKDAGGHEKEFTIAKRFYSTVAIPGGSEDPNLHNDRENIALMAASYYGKVIESAMLLKTGQPSKIEGFTLTHAAKIQEDNFLAATVYNGKDRVAPNKLKKGLDRSTVLFSAVDLHMRSTPTKDKKVDPKDKDAKLRINLTGEKVYKKGQQVLKAEVHRQKRCIIKSDANTPVEIREVAKMRSFEYLQERIEDGGDPQNLIDNLEDHEIDQRRYVEWLESKNDRHLADFQDKIHLLSDPRRIQDLPHLYAPGFPPVSEATKALFPKEPGKLRRAAEKLKFKKPVESEFGSVIDTLMKARKRADGEQLKEINLLLACCYKAFKEMDSIDRNMLRNENSAEEIQPLPPEVAESQDAREDTLNEINAKFKGKIDDSLLDVPKPPPPGPAPGVTPPSQAEAATRAIIDRFVRAIDIRNDPQEAAHRADFRGKLERTRPEDLHVLAGVLETMKDQVNRRVQAFDCAQYRLTEDLEGQLIIQMKSQQLAPGRLQLHDRVYPFDQNPLLLLIGGYLKENNAGMRLVYDTVKNEIHIRGGGEKEREKETEDDGRYGATRDYNPFKTAGDPNPFRTPGDPNPFRVDGEGKGNDGFDPFA